MAAAVPASSPVTSELPRREEAHRKRERVQKRDLGHLHTRFQAKRREIESLLEEEVNCVDGRKDTRTIKNWESLTSEFATMEIESQSFKR